jgi:hypothetical protein
MEPAQRAKEAQEAMQIVMHEAGRGYCLILGAEGKAIPVTGRGGPQGYERSRLHIF